MTQSELAGDRFSKEYLSQIERGKARPTSETLRWLASRLGVEPAYLESGFAAEERDAAEAALALAEALSEGQRHDEAVASFARARASLAGAGAPSLELRCLLGESRARVALGQVQDAIDLLHRARGLAERRDFSDADRAAVLLQLGVCRAALGSVSTAASLLDAALELADRSDVPCERLRADILSWRSRCLQRRRLWASASADVEQALELAKAMGDLRAAAATHLDASLRAEQVGHPQLARAHAERARDLYEQLDARASVGRLLTSLGVSTFQLGESGRAAGLLEQASEAAVDAGDACGAARAACALAEVRLAMGDPVGAEGDARSALELFGEDTDELEGIGRAQHLLGHSLVEQGRLDEAEAVLIAADTSLKQTSSVSHRAATWVALGDLAAKRGMDAEAARQYRRAAQALQDFRF